METKNCKKKKTLKAKMLRILMLCAMTSLLAAGIVSYMTLRIIRDDSILDNMTIYLDQITQDTDNAYYDMLSIVNQMGSNGLIGNVVEKYLGAQDNYERYIGQKSLREGLVGLGYVNTKLVGASYYDPWKKQELIQNMNVKALDGRYMAVPEVIECAGNVMQSVHPSYLGIDESPVLSVKRNATFGGRKKLDIYVEIKTNMSVPEKLNKEKWPYTYIQMDQNGIVRYSTNPVIICGQQILSKTLEKESYSVFTREGYKIMAYCSRIGYINAVALPDDIFQNEINMWRLKMVVIIAVTFLIFSLSVVYLYRMICRPLSQFRKQMIQVGNGALETVNQESEIVEFDNLMCEVEQMKYQIENLINNVIEKEKSIQRTEYEKLLYQINPHFLLNTLNSVQWMARMNHQDDITKFLQRLKKLLSYNLGKEGTRTTLRTEIDIVKDYIALQQMRCDFSIEMNVEEGDYLEQPTVRMLFQPLVENAIRYGLGNDEKIAIQVFEDKVRSLAVITITDSGKGMTQEEINQINEPFNYDFKNNRSEKRGIGLRYVKAMLESFYEGQTSLFVNSGRGRGTKVTILLPIVEPF